MHNIFRKISVILRFMSPYEFDIKEYRNGQLKRGAGNFDILYNT